LAWAVIALSAYGHEGASLWRYQLEGLRQILAQSPKKKTAQNLPCVSRTHARLGSPLKELSGLPTALTLRYENYNDKDGFITSQSQTLSSFTVTGEYKWAQGLLSRLEYRRDWSDRPFFERGSAGSPLNISGLPFTPGPWKNQDTLTVGFVAFFGPK
jgi:hypothetical protein